MELTPKRYVDTVLFDLLEIDVKAEEVEERYCDAAA